MGRKSHVSVPGPKRLRSVRIEHETLPLDIKALGWVEAEYREQALEAYRGNPLIEALPDIQEPADAILSMRRGSPASPEERALSATLRKHAAMRLLSVVHPLTAHVEISQKIAIAIRLGYVNRNPLTDRQGVTARLRAMEREAAARRNHSGPAFPEGPDEAIALTVIGYAGVGKSTAVRVVLDVYPKVIVHRSYGEHGLTVIQVPWLKLTCPPDGSLRSLCIWFFLMVDRTIGTTDYTSLYVNSRATETTMQIGMAAVIDLHKIGLLAIDEIQNLREAKGDGAAHMMSYLTTLSNEMRIPVLAIGTEDAIHVLGGALRQGRRATGLGLSEFERLRKGREFDGVCGKLWEALVLRNAGEPDPNLLEKLYVLSQGITDILVKLLLVAQSNALGLGIEALDEELLQEAYDANLYLVHPFLDAIRGNKKVKQREFQQALDRLASEMGIGNGAAVAAGKPAGKPARSRKAKAGGGKTVEATGTVPSPLVAIVHAGRERGLDAYASLKEAGLVWDMVASLDFPAGPEATG